MSPVLPARMPSLPWSVPVVRPFIPRSRRNAVTPLCFFDRSTEANTRKWSARSARRDPDLLAVEAVGAAVAPGRRREVAGVGPDAGLGQAERRELLAAGLGDEPALALLLGPPLEERERVQPDVDALDDAERGIGPLELLAQDREADVVHAGAAIALRDRRAEEALLGHLPEQLAGKAAVLVPLADVRQDFGIGERPDGLLDEAVLVGEAEVDHRPNASARVDARTSPTAFVAPVQAMSDTYYSGRWKSPLP